VSVVNNSVYSSVDQLIRDARWSVECGRKLFEPVDNDWLVSNTCDFGLDCLYESITIIGDSLFSLESASSEKILISLAETTVEGNTTLSMNIVKDVDFEQPISRIEEVPEDLSVDVITGNQ